MLVLALGLTVLPATDASAWSRHHTQTQPAKMSTAEISLLTTVLDKVAITDIELSPFGRMIVNSVLRTLMPKLCPVVADLAAPGFHDFVLTGCQGVASAPDPYGALLGFLPLACSLRDTVFPDYKELLAVVSGLLLCSDVEDANSVTNDALLRVRCHQLRVGQAVAAAVAARSWATASNSRYSSPVSAQSSNWMTPISLEALAQPAVVGVEQAELLAVRARSSRTAAAGRSCSSRRHLEQQLDASCDVDAHALPHLLLQEAVAHAHRGLERELLALAHLGVGELVVVLLQRQHAEGDVAGLVAHHVAQQLLEQRLVGESGT